MITVIKKGAPENREAYRFYIGRPGPLGNPFIIGNGYSREDVIAKYESWLRAKLEGLTLASAEFHVLLTRAKLSDVELVCFCAPLPCHGDVIKKLLEEQLDGGESL